MVVKSLRRPGHIAEVVAVDRDTPSASAIPIVLLTGFLGTGKTTLLKELLCDPALTATAVLINELGEVGLDHQLVFGAGGAETGDAGAGLRTALLLANGCVCCTVRDDLAVALDDLLVRREQGRVPLFTQVVIETTGLANPVPIIASLAASPIAAEHYRLAQVICTVDAAAPMHRLDRQPESLAQVVTADTLVLTRTDLAGAADIRQIEARLAVLNPKARMLRSVMGRIPACELLGIATGDRASQDAATLALETTIAARTEPVGRAGIAGIGKIRPLFHSNVRTQTLRFSGPSVWGDTSKLINDMASTAGEELLRVKGVLRLADYPEPMVVQWAGGRLSPIEPLPGALVEGDAGYLVIISAARGAKRA